MSLTLLGVGMCTMSARVAATLVTGRTIGLMINESLRWGTAGNFFRGTLRADIVIFRRPGTDLYPAVRPVKRRRTTATRRQGCVRAFPHRDNGCAHVEPLIDAVL